MKTKLFLCLVALSTLVFQCKNDDEEMTPQPEAFTYSGSTNFSTGNTSVAGTASPSGYSWSEVKSPQSTWGYTGTVTDRQIIEDFQVPSGEKWKIDNFYFYAYQTGFSGTTFPVTELYLEIYSSNPSVAGAVKIYGDMTTNRYVSSEETKFYRILQGQTSDTTRKIYKLKSQTADLNLTAGTYWIKWGSKTSSGFHFYPQLPNDPSKMNNAMQFIVSPPSYILVADSGQNVTFPIDISGTKLPN